MQGEEIISLQKGQGLWEIHGYHKEEIRTVCLSSYKYLHILLQAVTDNDIFNNSLNANTQHYSIKIKIFDK